MNRISGAVSLVALARLAMATCSDACSDVASSVPPCATSCIFSAAATQASCMTTDFGCQCANSDVIQLAAVDCVLGACGPDLVIDVLFSVSDLCSCVTAHPTTACSTAPATSAPASTTEDSSPAPTSTQIIYPPPPPLSTSQSTAAPPPPPPPQSSSPYPPPPPPTSLPYPPPPPVSSSAPVSSAPVSSAPVSSAPAPESSAPAPVSSSSPADSSTSSSSPCPTSEAETAPASHPVSSSPSAVITTAPPACDDSPASPCQSAADAVPACATSCIFSAAVSRASCATSDFSCQCAKQDVIQNAALDCVLDACGVATAVQVLPSVSALCDCVSAHPATSGPSQCAPTSAPPVTNTNAAPATTLLVTTQAPSPTSAACLASSGEGNGCDALASTAIPGCAQACFTSAAPKITCDVHDYGCQCQPTAQASLSKLLIPCVATACPAASLQAVIDGASSVCGCAAAAPTAAAGDCGAGGAAPPAGSTGGAGGGEGGSGGSGTAPPVVGPNSGTRVGISITAGLFVGVLMIAIAL